MAFLLEWKARDGYIHFRLLDRINRKQVTVIGDLGRFEPFAEDMKTYYRKAKSLGFVFTPPTTVADIEGFLKAKAEGQDPQSQAQRMTIDELCDLWIKLRGPSIKGGVSDHCRSAYRMFKLRIEQLKRAWTGRYVDSISLYDARDLLASVKQPGTKMRWIGSYGAMFKGAARWNVLGNILPYKIRLPPYNPFKEWRAEMPAAQKLELPDERVLEDNEWDKFKVHLTVRSRAICETALRRFLRLADIKQLSHLSQRDAYLQGLQQKTGKEFLVPMIQEAPVKYDFTNFLGDFKKAQVAAGMDWPADDQRHFSPKDLRRTGATWAWRGGEDILKISAMLGHKKLSTTQRYLRIRLVDVQSVADTVDAMADRKTKRIRLKVKR
jgi:integrase